MPKNEKENYDDDELALFDSLEDIFKKVEQEDNKNVMAMSTPDLLEELVDTEDYIIHETHERLKPRTQGGRDAHSRRNAIQIELRRRGIDA